MQGVEPGGTFYVRENKAFAKKLAEMPADSGVDDIVEDDTTTRVEGEDGSTVGRGRLGRDDCSPLQDMGERIWGSVSVHTNARRRRATIRGGVPHAPCLVTAVPFSSPSSALCVALSASSAASCCSRRQNAYAKFGLLLFGGGDGGGDSAPPGTGAASSASSRALCGLPACIGDVSRGCADVATLDLDLLGGGGGGAQSSRSGAGDGRGLEA